MNRYFLQFLLVVFVSISLSGCLSLKAKPKPQKSLPGWVLNPLGDTSEIFYGVGQGSNLDQAKNSALKEISSKISISVGGSTSLSSFQSNQDFTQSALVQVNTSTKDKQLQSYNVQQTTQRNGDFYALVSINKTDLSNSWSAKLGELDRSISNDVRAMNDYSVLKQVVNWQTLGKKLDEASSLVTLIKVVNPAFSERGFQDNYQIYRNRSRDSLNQLKVYVYSNQAELRPVIKEVIRSMTDEGIKSSNSRSQGSNTLIEISSNERKALIYSSFTIDLRLTFSVRDAGGKTIATSPVNVSGSSVIDYASARISAANNLGKKINKIGLFKLLGIIQ